MASLTRTHKTAIIGTALVLTFGLAATSPAQVIVGGYGYPYRYRYAAPDASVKFDVKPKDTAVYVDGYYAGLVDDYDGAFQRLRTAPGGHEITLFLEGYRTFSQHVYLSVDNTFKLKTRMEKLPGGVASERPPAPQPPPQPQYEPGQGAPLPGQGAPLPGEVGAQPPQPRGPYGRYPRYPPPLPPQPAAGEQADANGARGTLVLTLQPADAEVLVDGTPWRSDRTERLTIDLSEGRHNIQIRKPGFVGYLTDVQIRRGEAATLDVQLKTQPR